MLKAVVVTLRVLRLRGHEPRNKVGFDHETSAFVDYCSISGTRLVRCRGLRAQLENLALPNFLVAGGRCVLFAQQEIPDPNDDSPFFRSVCEFQADRSETGKDNFLAT